MSGFSGDWLALREPFDAAARASAAQALRLDEALADLVARRTGPHLHVVDLACGTGANLRALSLALADAGAREQQWTVLDVDAELLDQWPARLDDWRREHGLQWVAGADDLRLSGPVMDIRIDRRQVDLSAELETIALPQADLVTASALLDLVSLAWVDRLVRCCAHGQATVLMALSVDGRHEWSPPDAQDALVAAAFAEHQQRDKGFGPALGRHAASAAAWAFESADYELRASRSDWQLDERSAWHRQLLCEMIDGVAAAAAEQRPAMAAEFEAWRTRRRAIVSETRLVVGHVDLLAVPRAKD